MADVFVSIVLKKLQSVFNGIEEGDEEGDIKSLTDKLTTIQDVLQDAEDKQVENIAVKVWLEEFKEISYDAEDIIDEWNTRSIRNVQHLDLRKVQSHLFSFFSCFKHIVIQNDIVNKIRELNERLVGVVKVIQVYDLRKIRRNEQHRPVSSHLVDVSGIYGRVDDRNDILEKLLNESDNHDSHVPVISIVGRCGFGKTTLAQLILEQMKQHSDVKFDKYMWVHVSDSFNLEKITKEIIEQANGKVPDIAGWAVLHKSLYESVREKRFILVLDDVWSHNGSDWRQLKQALDGGAKGSRILITTRDERVADLMNSSYTHLLGKMSEDNCWSLFKRIAFSRREDDLVEFATIGKDISKRCNGVPLVVRAIASIMCFKREKQEWETVLASNIWEVQEGILASILLSYYALPSYLKLCLMYFAVSPNNVYEKKEMIKLWMAQGYLGSADDGSADLEMKGRDYFDILLKLSFLQILKRDKEGNISSCKMHNFVHDFVQFISEIKTIDFGSNLLFSSDNVRHLCAQDLNWSSIYKVKKLRTLRSFSTSTNWKGNGTVTPDLLRQLQCLRVLILRGYHFKELPSEVDQLLQLRYLDLSDNSMLEILPETICSLLNLQTLNLNQCKFLTRLPEGIGKLSKLRHLEIEGCEFRPYYSHRGLHYFPRGIGRLRCLRTLCVFIVGAIDVQSNQKGCMIEELKWLNNLEGHLKISGLGQVSEVGSVAQAELKMKEKLRSLVLDFGWKQEEEEVMRMEGILESLQPHTNLKKLVIKYFQGIRLPSWISSLSNLTVLTLMDLHLLQSPVLRSLAKLESLEFLHLHGLISVKSLGGEFYELDDRQVMFPKLKKLVLSSMPNLEELDLAFEIQFFPNLRELVIREFSNLRKLRIGWLPGLRELLDLGKLNSLKTLEFSRLDGLKHSFHTFMGISTKTNGGRVEFPALTNLCLFGMTEWEEKVGDANHIDGTSIMPRLRKLSIHGCPKLKVIPFYMFSHTLRELTIEICPKLKGIQPSLPPLLEKLKLEGDVGELSGSLLLLLHNNPNNYPNLNYFQISNSSQSSLPQGFNLLTSIRQLGFHNCESLDFMADDLKHLTELEQLEISYCPILAGYFSKGDISSSSSHKYKIVIRLEQQISTEIESSHSDLEKSSQSDVNVHSGICCDNCEMYPIDVMRNTLEVLICYNTPSKHPDLANQHHTQGHTFEHISN